MNLRSNWLLWKRLSGLLVKSATATTKRRFATISGSPRKLPHTPVLLNETLYALDIQPLTTVIDMTFGAGGHTREILSNFDNCHVIALDCDEVAVQMAEKLSTEQK